MSVGYFWVGETLFWMDVGAWGCMRHYLGQVEVSGVSGTLFWLGGVGGALFWVGGVR